MSDNVFQTSLRCHIPELDGKTDEEVLDIFREKLGEPEYEGEVYWDEEKHEIVPIYDYVKKRWGLQRVFIRSSDFGESARVSVETIQDTMEKMQELFPGITEGFVSSYSFYNGVDEPIEL